MQHGVIEFQVIESVCLLFTRSRVFYNKNESAMAVNLVNY